MMMMHLFSWFQQDRPAPIPDAMWQVTIDSLPFLHGFTADELVRLRSLTEDFLADKEFSTAEPLTLTDAMCLSIAVQGCLPILNLGLNWYRGWKGIIVYADEFVIPRSVIDDDGVVHEYEEVASGEAWEGGPLLISWSDAQLAGEGYNVVIHEFAHKLDMLNGVVDGMPPLHQGMSVPLWRSTLLDAYEDHSARVARDEETLFDPYGAEDLVEFFAVVSEAFFETPVHVSEAYPALYAQLMAFYRQDPSARLAGHTRPT